jgi:cation diffusion facilitator CzcD-associated flavoprotein CzcO
MRRSGKADGRTDVDESYDCVIVGAGFSGLAMLFHIRQTGLRCLLVDRQDGVGGTWRANRYPGVRTDSDYPIYSFSFSREVREEWSWSQRYATGDEVLGYLEFVAARLDLLRDMRFGLELRRAALNEESGLWLLDFNDGSRMACRYLISCMGILTRPVWPAIPGLEDFTGTLVHSGQWPTAGLDLSGQRVGLIGLGSSGLQILPTIAPSCNQVVVFQREPNYVVDSTHFQVSDEEMQEVRRDYDQIWERAQSHPFGVDMEIPPLGAMDVDPAERERIFESKWREGGHHFANETFNDLSTSLDASRAASEFIRGKIRQIVKDPAIAELLCPKGYSFNGKRVPTSHRYYETYNLPQVRLVDLKTTPIVSATSRGLRVGDEEIVLDVLICATGYDAMTGPLTSIDIVGRGGQTLAQKWAEGVRTNLGISMNGFPNLLLSLGPQTPYSNLPVPIQLGAQWVARAIAFAESNDIPALEATRESEDWWADEVERTGRATVMVEEGRKAKAWFLGANVPGKPLDLLVYMGGGPQYQVHCRQAEAENYASFRAAEL